MNSAAESDHFIDDLLAGFEHHDLLTGGERDDCVGSRFNVLDQVGVQDQRKMVEPCNLNHLFDSLMSQMLYR